MKSKEYWKKRTLKIEDDSDKKAKKYIKTLEEDFRIAQREIQKDINMFYSKYAKNNKITFDEASKILNTTERKQFQGTLNDYITRVRGNIDGRFNKELRNTSLRVRITRYQELLTNINFQLNNLYQNYELSTTEFLGVSYQDSYYRNLHMLQSGLGFGTSFSSLNDNAIKSALTYPWSGKDFSNRIWSQKDTTISRIRAEVTQGIIRGESIQKQSSKIVNSLGVSRFNAERLVTTENNYFLNEGSGKSYEETDIEQYEYLATLDLKTSSICRSLDGKIFEVSKRQAGTNYPSMHPFCRSTTIPVIEEDFEEDGLRSARNPNTNEVYMVPANMKYDDWHNKYVK